jgi:hypothetical protein
MSRSLKKDWIESYIEDIEPATESPTKYHFWAAASCIAATLKRSVWIDRVKWKLYPNLFTVLVGRPGIGKGAAMGPAVALMKEAGTVNILSDRITMEYVLEKLSKGFPKIHPGQPAALGQATSLKLGSESAALLVSTELSVFITASQFSITALSDLWDSKEGIYQYGTRGKGEWNINSPCVSLLGGSAQEWLIKSVPGDAVGGGFTRRVNFVFASRKDKRVAWPSNSHHATPILADDLRQMSLLRGEFSFTPGARRLFEDYYLSSEPDEFDDEATASYKTSKWANASKLAQILSISRGDTLCINEQDFQTAIDKTEEVSKDLRVVFRAVGESELAGASEKVIKFLEARGFASRAEILQCNWRHITSNQLDVIIATFREAGMLYERVVGNKTLFAWHDPKGAKNP